MDAITHRRMRNDSADVLVLLSAQGQLREARSSPAGLMSVTRKKSKLTTAEIVADVRGRW